MSQTTEKLAELKTQHQSIRTRIGWELEALSDHLIEIRDTVGSQAEKTQAENIDQLSDAELIAFSKKIGNLIKAEQRLITHKPNILQSIRCLIQQFLVIIEETRQVKFPITL